VSYFADWPSWSRYLAKTTKHKQWNKENTIPNTKSLVHLKSNYQKLFRKVFDTWRLPLLYAPPASPTHGADHSPWRCIVSWRLLNVSETRLKYCGFKILFATCGSLPISKLCHECPCGWVMKQGLLTSNVNTYLKRLLTSTEIVNMMCHCIENIWPRDFKQLSEPFLVIESSRGHHQWFLRVFI
jgi:hypothetical protein